MPILTRRRVIAAKIEAVEGVAETITAAEGGVMVTDLKFEPDIKMNPRQVLTETLSKFQPVPGTQAAKVSFRGEIKGAGSAYSSSLKPAIGTYLRACGFGETVDETPGTENVVYAPASTGVPSLTIAVFNDGLRHIVRGARGSVKFGFKNGEICYCDFEFLGVYDSSADVAMIAPTYEATVPPALLGASLTVGGYAAKIQSLNLDMGNVLALRDDISSAQGYFSTLLTDRRPTGSFDPEMELVATHDFYGLWKGGTAAALAFNLGATQYNRIGITAPKLVYTKIGDSDRNSLSVADSTFELAMNTGDDEIVLTFD